jgi:hypothetical protein
MEGKLEISAEANHLNFLKFVHAHFHLWVLCFPAQMLSWGGGKTRFSVVLIIYIAANTGGKGPGYLSRYSDSLRAGRYMDRIPVGARFSVPVQTGLWGPFSLLYIGYRVFLGGKAVGS